MAPRARKVAQQLIDKASNGAIRVGHLGLYQKLEDKLRAAREQLAGREELLEFDKIRRALDAKIEELTVALQDPSVADHVAISEGVYKLLHACQPLWLALNDGTSLEQACDALDAAGAVLDDFADQDAAYKEYRKLNGGWVTINGKRVKLDAKAFAKWKATHERANQNFAEKPYKHTNQTTQEHVDAFNSVQKTNQRRERRYVLRSKRAREEDEEPTPPELEMRVMADGIKKYRASPHLIKYAPGKRSNPFTTMEAAMELVALCLANRPEGTTREEQQAARAQKGLPDASLPIPTAGTGPSLCRRKKRSSRSRRRAAGTCSTPRRRPARPSRSTRRRVRRRRSRTRSSSMSTALRTE